MGLENLLREAIANGRLREPFSPGDATEALGRADWSVKQVHSFLVRYCRGNLAARLVFVDRVSFGRYRLLGEGKESDGRSRSSARRGWVRRGPGGNPLPLNGSDN